MENYCYNNDMKKQLTAEIITIGTELLLGEIIDTNASFIAEQLNRQGIGVFRRVTVGDNFKRLTRALQEGLQRADILITTGGLGPTDDDITREAIACVCNEQLHEDHKLLEDLKALFARRNRSMTANNKKQAMIIKSAEALNNSYGTACGWLVRSKDKIIIALPGPPEEMRQMWLKQVLKKLPEAEGHFYFTTIHTIGTGESTLAEKIADFTTAASPGVGIYARGMGVDVRVGVVSDSAEKAQKIVEPVAKEIELRLAENIFGRDEETIVSAIRKFLDNFNQSVSCMESVTGGMLAAFFTDCPGISSCFHGSVTAYNEKIKADFGVSADIISEYGVVSEQVAIEMARAAKKQFATDWAVSTTGVAGPNPHDGKKPGTAYIGISGPDISEAFFVDWPGSRMMVRQRICKAALYRLWGCLKKVQNER
ncbi:MAG: competence/damage-inducible protein A [Candidatus Rifleibacteriota bacterium]